MQMGMVGLGRMGGNMVERLMRRGHSCVVYDRNPDAVKLGAKMPDYGLSQDQIKYLMAYLYSLS